MIDKFDLKYSFGIGLLYWSSAMYLIGKWSVFNIDIFAYMSLSDILNLGASKAITTSIFFIGSYLIGYIQNQEQTRSNNSFIFVAGQTIPERFFKKYLNFKSIVLYLAFSASLTFIEIAFDYKINSSAVYAITFIIIFGGFIFIGRQYQNLNVKQMISESKENSHIYVFLPLYTLFLLGTGALEAEQIINGKSANLVYNGPRYELRDTTLIGHAGQTDFYYGNEKIYIVSNGEITNFKFKK